MPPRPVAAADVSRVITRLAQLQIDSVNVVARAHYLPLFSRLGPYDTTLLDRASHRAPRRLFEYWGHAASLIDVSLMPALRFRMDHYRDEPWEGVQGVDGDGQTPVSRLLDRLRQTGAQTARQLETEPRSTADGWWSWSATKVALEWMFAAGLINSAGRTAGFERRYDLIDKVVPIGILAREMSPEQARLELVRRAASALGIGTVRCLADYFRLKQGPARVAVAELVERGELVEVAVEGWTPKAYLWHGYLTPTGRVKRLNPVTGGRLISPFDSLIFERVRALGLFDLDYRIEIYTPAPKRRYGYYVYPFLLDEGFAARVDLKADRIGGVLRVQAAWAEPGNQAPDAVVCDALAAELERMAGWLGLPGVAVAQRGDLAAALARVVRGRGSGLH